MRSGPGVNDFVVYCWNGDGKTTDLVRLLELADKLVHNLDFRLDFRGGEVGLLELPVRFQIKQSGLNCVRLVALFICC
jgi:hypothetical protein